MSTQIGRPSTLDRLIELDGIVSKYVAVTEKFNDRPDVAGAYSGVLRQARDTQTWLRDRIIRVTKDDII